MGLVAAGTLVTGCLTTLPAGTAVAAEPDFGPNVKIFGPETSADTISSYLQSIAREGEFSTNRHAVFFRPGTYGSAAGAANPATATGIVNSTVGYYTSIAGLGASPNDVVINGALHVNPAGAGGTLTNFWRSLSNLSINPIQRQIGSDAETVENAHSMRWAVSQATPLRRVDIQGNLDLVGRNGSYGFGSVLMNSAVRGTVSSGSVSTGQAQAQWYTRDSQIGGWNGEGASLVFSGVQGAPAGTFGAGGTTTLPTTPVSREAPFLYLDGDSYAVFAPAAKTNTSGVHWTTTPADGRRIPIEDFLIARPTTGTTAMNQALAAGRHLLLTPGVHTLDAPLRVTQANTVVLGLGMASLNAPGGKAAIEVGDVEGVHIAGVTVDAGAGADALVRIGTQGVHAGSATNPTTLSDVFVRVGGPRAGRASTCIEVNSDHVLLDGEWIWRADHGTGAGWTSNTSDHGLVVNGDDVTALGLFVEHHQKEQVIWNGERGTTIFYQSEMPYDPPNQSSWMNGTSEGYPSYVVADGVTTHSATGLAVYTLFTGSGFSGPGVHASSAIQAPVGPEVRFRSMVAGVIMAGGGIRHVINDRGDAVDSTRPNKVVLGMTAVTRLVAFPV